MTVSYDKVYCFIYNTNKKGYVKESKKEELSLVKVDGTSGKPDFWKADMELYDGIDAAFPSEFADWKAKAMEQNSGLTQEMANAVTQYDAYSLKNIKIDIKTELETDRRGTVTVSGNDIDMSYDITGTAIDRIGDTNQWEIGEDADLLVLTVNAGVKPVVRYETEHADDIDATWGTAEVNGSNGAYTAKIPVSKLETVTNDDGDVVIEAKISISKGDKTLHVYNSEAAELDFKGKIKIAGPEGTFPVGYKDAIAYTGGNTDNKVVPITNGSEVTVTLYAEKGSLFDSASYTFVNDGEKTKHDINISADKTEATFTVKMTDDVKVITKTEKTFRYVVTYLQNGEKDAEDEGNGVYAIPAGVTTVKVKAFNGPADSDKQKLYNVKVFDGGAAAACTASIGTSVSTDNHIVTLGLKKEDGALIRLELKGKKTSGATITLPSISIRQDKMADEILIKDEEGNKVESVNLLPGESKGPYCVEVKSGSLSFMNGNIEMEIARDASKAGQQSSSGVTDGKMTVTYDGIKATYDTKKKTLMIEGVEGKKGNDNPVTLRFYDVAKRNNAISKNEADKLCVIAGSEVSVKLDSPAITNVTPTVVANNTVHNLQLRLGAPGIDERDGVYYRIKITGTVKEPKEENATDEDGNPITDEDGNPIKVRRVVDNVQLLDTPYIGQNHSGDSGREIWIKHKGWDSQDILIPVNYDYDGTTLKEKVQEYSLTVELVQKMKAGSDAIWTVGNSNLIVSPAAKLTTKTAEAVYPTDLTLDKTSATIYTGQGGQKIATASFGDVKGVRQLTPTFINVKTGVEVGDNWSRNNVNGWLNAWADLDGNIYVGAENMRASMTLPKDLGLKVSAFAKDAREISKIITLKFVNGVNSDGIRFENGNNRVLYRQEGKKATLKLKAVINEDSGVKAKNTNQIVYSLGDAEGDESWERDYKLSSNLQNNVTVNAKNGTVTVAKDYLYKDGDNKFSVIARVADTEIKAAVTVTISQTAQEMGSIVIVDSDGKVIARDGGTLSAETFKTKTLYVRALKSTAVQTNNRYGNSAFDYENSYAEGVSFTSGNKKALAISTTNGRLTMAGASNKAVKITAVNTDGSKKVKSTISVNLTGPKALGIEISGAEGKWEGSTKTYKYSGSMKQRFVVTPIIYVNEKDQDGNTWRRVTGEYYKNLKITVKNAKKTERKGENRFEIVKTAPVTTITISDKTDKSVAPVTYTIEQSPAMPVTGKALKIKTVTKLTEAMLNEARSAAESTDGTVAIKLQISGKDAAAYAGKYIMLTPDYSKNKLVNKIAGTEEYRRANSYFLDENNEKAVKIDADGSFTLELDMWRKAAQERIPGTYTLVAAVGQYGSKGVFEYMDGVKSANVSIKIPGKAPKKLALEMKGDYTLSTGGGEVDLADGISSAYVWDVEGTVYNNTGVVINNSNLAKNAVNSDGTVNSFKKYFYVKRVSDGYRLGMNTGIKLADLEALLKDTEGKDRKGFVTITSYNEMGAVETKDMEINVNLVQTGTLIAKADDAYKGTKAVVRIYDANGNALDLYSANLDKSAAAQTDVKSAVKTKDDKSIEVEIDSKAGDSVSVDLKVLTKDSAFATADGRRTEDTYLQKYGDSVKAEIKLADPSTASDTVEVLTKEEDLAFKAELTLSQYGETNSGEYNENNKYNSYFDNGSSKKYGLRVDVKSKISGAEVSSAEIDKACTDTALKNILTVTRGKKNNEILLILDQKKFLQECVKEGATVEKGGTITVPVTVGFTLNAIQKQTIEMDVKLPSPKTYAEAVADMRAAQSEIENMKPDEYLKAGSSEGNLKKKINEAFRNAVPLDAEAFVEPAGEINLTKTGENSTYDAVTIRVKEKSTKQDKDYEHEFVWDVISDTKWDAGILIEEIRELLKPNGGVTNGKWLEDKINALESNKTAGKIVDNSYTEDDFVKDLTALLKSEENIALGKSMIIKAEFKKKQRATKSAPGLIEISIQTRDGEDKGTNFDTDAYKTTTKLRISKITNLGEEGAAVKNALDAIDYNQAVYEALGQGDIAYLEQNLENKIRSVAEGALTNKNISIAFEPTGTTDGDDNAAPGERNIAIKLPYLNGTTLTDGYLKFKVLVKLEGMSDYVIDYTTSSKTLDEDWKSKDGKTFQRLDQIDTVFTTNNALTTSDKVLTWAAATPPATLKKATFVEKIEVTDSLKADAETRVKELVGKLVNGMYLEVSVDVNDRASGASAPVTGTVTVTDSTGRSKVDGNKYKFDFELNVTATLAEGVTESKLGDPVRRSKTRWDNLGAPWTNDNNLPEWDRVSGLTVGEPKKVDDNTYKVALGGTLKYVENWTGFSSDTTKQSGYYAVIDIPIPTALKTITDNDSNASIDYIQVAGDLDRRFNGSVVKGENGTFGLIQRMTPETDHSEIQEGTISQMRGFKVVVDYDGLTGGADALATGNDGSPDHKTVTYIFDASGVKLDNTSEAEVTFGATDSDITELKSLVNITGISADNKEILLTGSNNGKSDVIKASGSLKKITAPGFNGSQGHTDENSGYYAVVTVKVPKNVATTYTSSPSAGGVTKAELVTYNPATWGDADHIKTSNFSSLSDDENKFDTIATIVRVNDDNLNFDKKSITFTVDWDGSVANNWKPKTYILDLSDVVYER